MTTNKVTLGVVAISYNEEQDLPGFLSNLVSWVDEIVIMDDGSTDRTLSIATNFDEKVKFIVSPRKEGEYYAQQRNKGINNAQSDWLLHMDIDERVTPELAKEIMSAIEDSSKDGYRYRRLNFFLHRPMKGGGWQDWNLVHLARRHLFHFEGMFHEECVLDSSPERIGQLQAKMWHLNDSSYKSRMKKSFNYSEEQSQRIANKYNEIAWFHLLLLPTIEFIRKLFLKQGYLDGTLGLMFAIHSADAMFRACALVWDEQNRIPRDNLEIQLKEKWEK